MSWQSYYLSEQKLNKIPFSLILDGILRKTGFELFQCTFYFSNRCWAAYFKRTIKLCYLISVISTEANKKYKTDIPQKNTHTTSNAIICVSMSIASFFCCHSILYLVKSLMKICCCHFIFNARLSISVNVIPNGRMLRICFYA